MSNMKKYFCFSVLLLFVHLGFCQTGVDTLVGAGNIAYEAGKYDTAISYYERVGGNGFESAELYYNLGNAHYKLNNIAASILNYEKAILLNPNDQDIVYNLKLAQLRTIDKIEVLPTFFISDWTTDISTMYSEDSWGLFALLFLWIGFLILAAYVLSNSIVYKKLAFVFGTVFLLGSFLCFGFANNQYDAVNNQQEAIVFSPSKVVKSSPGENGNDLFVLHEGTKVLLLDELAGWGKIQLSDGSIGWIELSAIKNI